MAREEGADSAALKALLEALKGGGGLSPQRVSVAGLVAAGPAAVDGLCETLRTSQDDRVLMFASDALADAIPRADSGSRARAAEALAIAAERLDGMVEASPRLKAWAEAEAAEDDGAPDQTGIFAKGRTSQRQQWQFAEDTALQACRGALERLAL